MKKLSFLLLFLPFIFVQKANAEASAKVNINNNVSSNTNTTTSVKNNIKIETNGHITEYSSDRAENIEIKTDNDKSEIKINGQVVSQSPSGGASATPTNKPSNESEKKNNEKVSEKSNLVEAVQEFIAKIFSIFD